MKASVITAVVLASIAMFSNNAKAYNTVGRVISVQEAPMLCTERRDNFSSSPVAMAISGGLAGNQFGSGNGKKAMTALGAIAGARIGYTNQQHNKQRIDCKRDGYINTIEFRDSHGRTMQTTRHTQYALPVGAQLNVRAR